MEESPVYPFITLPEGQFTIVDGFLINLNGKALNPDLTGGIEIVDESCSAFFREYSIYNSLRRLEKTASNYFLTRHSMFFRLMGIKDYVTFVKSREKYYCRKCDRSNATHAAFTVKFFGGKKPVRAKYIVFERALENSTCDLSELYRQQYTELERTDLSLKLGKRSWLTRNNGQKDSFNIEYMKEEELLKKIKSPTVNFLPPLNRYSERPKVVSRASLKKFQENLLRHCELISCWKLKKLIELLKISKELIGLIFDVQPLYLEGLKQIRNNLKFIDQRLFFVLMRTPCSGATLLKILSLDNVISSSNAEDAKPETTINQPSEPKHIKSEDNSEQRHTIDNSVDPSHYFLRELTLFCSYTEQSKIYIKCFFEAKEKYGKKMGN